MRRSNPRRFGSGGRNGHATRRVARVAACGNGGQAACSRRSRRRLHRRRRYRPRKPATRSRAGLQRRPPQQAATSSEGSWPSGSLPVRVRKRRLRYNLHQPTTIWQSSEAYANNRLGSTTAAATSAAADDARPGNGLLAGARFRSRRRTCPPRFLTLGLTAGLLAPRPRVFLVFILARGNGRRLRLFIADAGLAFQHFAGLAFDQADAGAMFGEFRDQFRRHADIGGRLTSDRHVLSERRAGRRVERAVGLAAETAEPDKLGLRRANQFGRIGLFRRTLGGFTCEIVQRSNHNSSKPIASEGFGEGLQILDARSFAALGGELLELALLVLAHDLFR